MDKLNKETNLSNQYIKDKKTVSSNISANDTAKVYYSCIDFNQPIPISFIDLSSEYRLISDEYLAKIKAKFEKELEYAKTLKSEVEYTKSLLSSLSAEKLSKLTSEVVNHMKEDNIDSRPTNTKLEDKYDVISNTEKNDTIEKLAKDILSALNAEDINTTELGSLKSKTDELERQKLINEMLDKKTVIAVKTFGSQKYIDTLIRAGINPEKAKELSTKGFSTHGYCPKLPIIPEPISKGKVVSTIDLPLPQTPVEPPIAKNPEPHTEEGKQVKNASEYKQKWKGAPFKPLNVTEEKTVRLVKKPSEVIEEYQKAVEIYKNRFERPLYPANKDKRGVYATATSPLPFNHPNRKITDVEIMFMADENMAKIITPEFFAENIQTQPEKLPRKTKWQKIAFHLKAIKKEIFRKSNG